MEVNKIYNMDARKALKQLPNNSIDCIVTSPPYYQLRDYGTNGQIGQENTPSEYIKNLVLVFEECHRVLKDNGTLWVNIGDSYAGSGKGQWGSGENDPKKKKTYGQKLNIQKPQDIGLKPKDLIGIPWRLAFALQDFGWYLRQDIIWHKPNPLPESVTDRCTKSHEYVFLLSKNQKYYYDHESIKEDTVYPIGTRTEKKRGDFKGKYHAHEDFKHISDSFRAIRDKRNKRDVWTVSTKAYRGAHFATFPEELIEPCILSGCRKGGVVLDPFFGSGTTGVVAKKYGRNFIGIELNSDYVNIANKRLETVQGILL